MSNQSPQRLSNCSSVTLLVNICSRICTVYEFALFLLLGFSSISCAVWLHRHQMPVQQVVSRSSPAFVPFQLPGDNSGALAQMMKLMVHLRGTLCLYFYLIISKINRYHIYLHIHVHISSFFFPALRVALFYLTHLQISSGWNPFKYSLCTHVYPFSSNRVVWILLVL